MRAASFGVFFKMEIPRAYAVYSITASHAKTLKEIAKLVASSPLWECGRVDAPPDTARTALIPEAGFTTGLNRSNGSQSYLPALAPRGWRERRRAAQVRVSAWISLRKKDFHCWCKLVADLPTI